MQLITFKNLTGVDADMITQEDTIFVAGMDIQSSEDDIAAHFGAIGVIKVTYTFFFFIIPIKCIVIRIETH